MKPKKSGEIDINKLGNLQTLQRTSTVKLDPTLIEENILASPFDFVNYVENKMPDKEARIQKGLFPLKLYESEKKTKYNLSELNPKKEFATQIYNKEKNIYFSMALEDQIIFSDSLGNINFYTLNKNEKKNKISKIIEYPFKNTQVKYKSYAMDISSDKTYSFVGYENGSIGIFEKTKNKQIINTGYEFNIINLKIFQQTKKDFQIISSDIEGNVLFISLKSKKSGFEQRISNICKGNSNTPYHLLYLLNLKDEEKNYNKLYKELNGLLVISNNENLILYYFLDKFTPLFTFNKPKYIKDICLPDVAIGLGKKPLNKEANIVNEDLVLLLAFSWEKVVYLKELNILERKVENVGYYVNEENIIRVGFLNISTIYLIDKDGNFKILNSSKFNQGEVSIDISETKPMAPMYNSDAEMQNALKINQIKSQSYLNNKNYKTYLYSIINNRAANDFYVFTENTIYHQSLINYETYLDNLFKKRDWNELFLLGIRIYKGEISALNGIPIKTEERKKTVKEFLQKLIPKFLENSWNNDIDVNTDILIEFCLEIDLGNYLFEKIIKIYESKKQKDLFLSKLEPFILCNKIRDLDIPKKVTLDLINTNVKNNDLDKLDQLLIHFSLSSLNHGDTKKKIEQLSLISTQIYLAINKEHDFIKPVSLLFDRYNKAKPIESFTNYKVLVKNKKMPLEKIKLCKQYLGHKLLWYLLMLLEGKKFPDFIEDIDGVLYFSAVTKSTYWLLTEKVFNEFILLDTNTFFNIINFIFSNEEIIDTFEEDNEDKTKKAEALRILKQNNNNLYKSENVDPRDLIAYIMAMGDKLINSSSKLEDEKKDKINLYLKTFVIAVGNITKSDKEIKKEAIIYIIKNINKHKIKLNVSEKMVKILEGKDFEPKDYDDILSIMTKGVFDEIHLLILKKKKQYIDCLKLLLDEEININKLDELLFTFINMTLTRLQIKKMKKEYISFKKEVINNLIKIAQKSLENCYTLINFWFTKDRKTCLNSLKENPQLQMKFIEFTIKRIIESKERNDFDYNDDEDYIKYLLARHIKLLVNLNRKNEILFCLKKLNDYPIKECIDICKKAKVYDSLIYLYKQEGNTAEALNICNEIIKNTFDEILNNFKSKDFDENLHNSKKAEFIQFIDDSICTIELEENSYGKEILKRKKSNANELWSDMLDKLYIIQKNFSKESDKGRNKIYNDIEELILTQIQTLIIRMSPYIGEQNVFDFVINVNPNANIIELRPFFYETLKSYGVEINILNFYMNSLREYSFDKEIDLENKNIKGDYFNLGNNYCGVCKNPLNTVTAKLVRFRCQHIQHFNCGIKQNICLKCLEDNYKRWACKVKEEKSEYADDKEYVEFLNTYKNVKNEMKNNKGVEEDKKGKKNVMKTGSSFNRKFGKLTSIDNYISKNRKNFILEGVKFYMNKNN